MLFSPFRSVSNDVIGDLVKLMIHAGEEKIWLKMLLS